MGLGHTQQDSVVLTRHPRVQDSDISVLKWREREGYVPGEVVGLIRFRIVGGSESSRDEEIRLAGDGKERPAVVARVCPRVIGRPGVQLVLG